MSDKSATTEDSDPVSEHSFVGSRRTLLRVLGGTAVAGSLSGIAFATGDGKDSDGYDLWNNTEWNGVEVTDNHVAVDYVGSTQPNANDSSKHLWACKGLEMTVKNDQISNAHVDSVHVHETVEKRCKKMLQTLANGKTPKEVNMAPDSLVAPLDSASTDQYRSIHDRVNGSDNSVAGVVKKEVNCGRDDGSLFIILIVLIIAFLATLFLNA